jgi:hypothetical protein
MKKYYLMIVILAFINATTSGQVLKKETMDSIMILIIQDDSVKKYFEGDRIIHTVAEFGTTISKLDTNYYIYFSYKNRKSWEKNKLNDSLTLCFNLYFSDLYFGVYFDTLLCVLNNSRFGNNECDIFIKIIIDNKGDNIVAYCRRYLIRRTNETNYKWVIDRNNFITMIQIIPRKNGKYFIQQPF